MIINHNQAIFDAIVAATGMDPQLGTILISTKKFIDTFNCHRDRKLCTSLDVAQQPKEPPAYDAMEAALRAIIIRCDEGDKKSDWLPIISDIAKRALQGAAQTPDTSGADGVAVYERGFTDGVFVGREMPQRIPCDKCGKPLHDADQNLRGHKILCDRCVEEPSPAATRDDDARARFLADRADTERKQASNPSSQASTSE